MRRFLAIACTAATVVTSAVFFTAGSAAADPSADDWYQLRMCESTNRYDINTGNGYYGAYQFDQATWNSVGGTGRPDQATAAEQDYRALILYRNRGWSPWVCAGLVGLSEDSDARTKVAPPVGGNQSSGSPASEGAAELRPPRPAALRPTPGGSSTRVIRRRNSRPGRSKWAPAGYDLVGTGYFGPKTEAAVLDLQAKAGLNVVGFIGPKTWAAAWDGGAAAEAGARRGARLPMCRRPTPPAGSASRPHRPGPASSSCRAIPTVTCSASSGSWAVGATD